MLLALACMTGLKNSGRLMRLNMPDIFYSVIYVAIWGIACFVLAIYAFNDWEE